MCKFGYERSNFDLAYEAHGAARRGRGGVAARQQCHATTVTTTTTVESRRRGPRAARRRRRHGPRDAPRAAARIKDHGHRRHGPLRREHGGAVPVPRERALRRPRRAPRVDAAARRGRAGVRGGRVLDLWRRPRRALGLRRQRDLPRARRVPRLRDGLRRRRTRRRDGDGAPYLPLRAAGDPPAHRRRPDALPRRHAGALELPQL